MNAIRIRKHLDSSTLVLPELNDMIGKDVEIIVLDDSEPAPAKFYSLRGMVVRYDKPTDPVAETCETVD